MVPPGDRPALGPVAWRRWILKKVSEQGSSDVSEVLSDLFVSEQASYGASELASDLSGSRCCRRGGRGRGRAFLGGAIAFLGVAVSAFPGGAIAFLGVAVSAFLGGAIAFLGVAVSAFLGGAIAFLGVAVSAFLGGAIAFLGVAVSAFLGGAIAFLGVAVTLGAPYFLGVAVTSGGADSWGLPSYSIGLLMDFRTSRFCAQLTWARSVVEARTDSLIQGNMPAIGVPAGGNAYGCVR